MGKDLYHHMQSIQETGPGQSKDNYKDNDNDKDWDEEIPLKLLWRAMSSYTR